MKKICIVASKYYEDITNMLVSGANDVLNNQKKKIKTKIIYVPGVFEIPYAISKNLKKYDAFIVWDVSSKVKRLILILSVNLQ